MIYNFQRLVETVSPAFFVNEKLDSWEMLDWLNRTQERYIRLKYLNQNSFEENVFRLSMVSDDLAKLIKTEVISSMQTPTHINYAKEIVVPDDFVAYIRSDSSISRIAPEVINNEKIGNVEINYDKIDNLITTHNNKPILEAPVITMTNSSIQTDRPSLLLIMDSYTTLKGFYLTYLRKPNKIEFNTECELAPYMHEDLVKLSVSMFLDEYKLKLAGGGKQNA